MRSDNVILFKNNYSNNIKESLVDKSTLINFQEHLTDANVSKNDNNTSDERQKQIDLLIDKALATTALPKEVMNIIKSHSFVYREKGSQDNQFGDYGSLFKDSIANGWNINGEIYIQSPVWKQDESNPQQLVDTFFHEIQHSRKVNNTHGNDLLSREYNDFINAYKPLVKIFNQQWGKHYQ